MTEADWNSCTDPAAMLDFLRSRRKLSPRKARLFAAVACRRVWALLADDAGRRAIEVAELFADGRADGESRSTARREAVRSRERAWGAYLVAANYIRGSKALRAFSGAKGSTAWEAAYRAAGAVTFSVLAASGPWDAADWSREAAVVAARAGGPAGQRAKAREERGAQATFLRCIFGNPLRLVPPLASSLLTSHDALVVKLARATYEERLLPEGTLERTTLAVLADALEEAGCAGPEILSHLREPGPHVRGCFALDLLLGRKGGRSP